MTFRGRLLTFGFAVAGMAALAVLLTAESLIRRSVTDRVTERLQAEALVLAVMLEHDPSALPDPGLASSEVPAADLFADRAGRSLGLRVTLIDPDGKVLGDSAVEAQDLARVDNHASRPEIVDARREGVGLSDRRSLTVRDDLLYLARRIDRDGRLAGFVRLAVPQREVERTTGRYGLRLALISFAGLLFVAVLGYLGARRFSRPIETMSGIADEIAAGRRDRMIEYASSDEIGRLGAAINRMTRALSAQIDALSAEKRLRDTMLDGMSEGLIVVDTDRRLLVCNNALRRLLGIREENPAGRSLLEITREHEVVVAFDAALLKGERRSEVVRLEATGGGILELIVVPLTDPGGATMGAVGLLFDITRLTALESVRREFVADVSHELRTPLTIIRSFVETLSAGAVDDPANNRRFLGIVMKHCDQMEALLNDLTDLSRIETGAVILDLESIELAPLARETLESVRQKAGRGDITLRLDVPAGLRARADRRRLDQILLNLLDNAIKFNKPGGTVTLRALPRAEEPAPAGGAVIIEVEDTGIGIPADSLEKVFHRFYRVDRSRSREMGGTGLGLSIVKHLVRLHGGTVRVVSRPGQGSRFILELPS